MTDNERQTIKQLRHSNQITQQELAKELAVKQSTVWRWENDKVKVSFSNRRALCKLFVVEPREVSWPREE